MLFMQDSTIKNRSLLQAFWDKVTSLNLPVGSVGTFCQSFKKLCNFELFDAAVCGRGCRDNVI